MDNKMLVCFLDMFTAEQSIFLAEDGNTTLLGKCSLADLEKTLLRFARENNTTEIKLYGLKDFTQGKINKVQNFFKENNLEIKVD